MYEDQATITELRRRCAELAARNAALVADNAKMRADNAAFLAALTEIRDTCGHVCPEFELCQHVACRDSYGAWHLANEAIGAPGREPAHPGAALLAELTRLRAPTEGRAPHLNEA